jgi:hypothetical protein
MNHFNHKVHIETVDYSPKCCEKICIKKLNFKIKPFVELI